MKLFGIAFLEMFISISGFGDMAANSTFLQYGHLWVVGKLALFRAYIGITYSQNEN